MSITRAQWSSFLTKLRKVNDAATERMLKYIRAAGIPQTREQMDAAIDFAFGLATKYGEAAAELACQMHDAVAIASGLSLPPAEPAPTATISEVAKAIRGTAKTGNAETIASSVGRQVKMAGVDTTMKNALRDGAYWAWVPHGDTCAFCLMLASNGWQRASKKAIKGGHAEHVHANCDCTYAISFNGRGTVEGYDPDEYKEMYDNAEGDTWQEKLNSMRRQQYADNAPTLRAQRRKEYAAKAAHEGGTNLHGNRGSDIINVERGGSGRGHDDASIDEPQPPSPEDLQRRADAGKENPENRGVIAEKVLSGEFRLNYRHNKYLQHKQGTRLYGQVTSDRGKPQSYLTITEAEAQQIVYDFAGTGTLRKNSTNVEFVSVGKPVGFYFDGETPVETSRVQIIHSDGGAHIVPVREYGKSVVI